jgi:hypothetical protein
MFFLVPSYCCKNADDDDDSKKDDSINYFGCHSKLLFFIGLKCNSQRDYFKISTLSRSSYCLEKKQIPQKLISKTKEFQIKMPVFFS